MKSNCRQGWPAAVLSASICWTGGHLKIGSTGIMNIHRSLTYPDGSWYEGEWSKHPGQEQDPSPDGKVDEEEWSNGNPQGHGKLTYPDGNVYEGEWSDGNPHGQGTFTNTDGSVYVGEWKNGKQHGQGKLTNPDGSMYDGGWSDGKQHGQGKGTDPSGSMYEGMWSDGNPHGQGKQVDASGSVYEGGWSEGKQHGQGKHTDVDGSVHEGEWSQGKLHGKGKLTNADGSIYEGHWSDGKQHGQGNLSHPDGSVYEGQWCEGQPHGQGKYINACSSMYLGEWNGFHPDGQAKGHNSYCSVYEGSWINGKRHGMGKEIDSEDSVYEGVWQDNEKHGKGVRTEAGVSYRVLYRHGIQISRDQLQGQQQVHYVAGAAPSEDTGPWYEKSWVVDEDSPHFQLGQQISGGAFSAVFGALILSQEVVATAHHALLNPAMYGLLDRIQLGGVVAEIMAEIAPLQKLRHRRIVCFVGVVCGQLLKATGSVTVPKYLLMEKVDGTTLHTELYDGGEKRAQMSEEIIRRLALELSEAVQYIHEQGFIHGDIKPENIFITAEDAHIKLADLGIAKIQACVTRHTMCGTPLYMAPEVVTGDYSNAVDVWAAALVICEMILRERPPVRHSQRPKMMQQATTQMPGFGAALRGGLATVACRMSARQFLQALTGAKSAGSSKRRTKALTQGKDFDGGKRHAAEARK